jgi:drug/metabolite transporter (DMT)-like permease
MIQKILQSTHLGGYALLISAMLYATFGVLIRAMAEMFGDNTQVVLRFGLIAALLLGWLVYRKRPLRLERSQVLPVLGLAVGCAILVMLFTYAVTVTTIAASVFSLYAGSIITSLIIGTIAFKEPLPPYKIVAVAVALAGLTLYSGGFTALSLGMAAGVLAGVFDGCTNALRKVLTGVSRLKVQTYQYGIGALFAALFIPLSGERLVTGYVGWWPIVAGLLFTVLTLGLGYLLLYGFQHFPVNTGTVILATELFFAAILGIIFFREWPSWAQMAGGCLIFAASVLAIRNPLRKR